MKERINTFKENEMHLFNYLKETSQSVVNCSTKQNMLKVEKKQNAKHYYLPKVSPNNLDSYYDGTFSPVGETLNY